ncbi:MAG TPA: HNH endonuclease [Candidatus Acidoferrum sp.]|nr:HNH endonuclease [Candidatus Acidoferrum sp.]
MAKENTCIYCKETQAKKFKGVEHVIPQSFGKFANQTPTLLCVCDSCNAFFMKELDQVFARDTVEGITRYKKGLYSRESRRQTRLTITIPKTDEMAAAGGVVTWVDGQTGNLMPPPLQVHFRSVDTNEYVPVFKNELHGLDWKKRGYSDKSIKIFSNSRDEYEEAIRLLDAVGIKYVHKSDIPIPRSGVSSDGTLSIEVSGTIDHVVKRAICKILFNFACKYLGVDEVLKPAWDKARNYIRFNSEPLKARMTNRPFWGQERPNWRLDDDSYNLRIENSERGVIGALQMLNLSTYEIILVEGYKVEEEVAMRFTPGMRPFRAKKMTHQDYARMMKQQGTG